jgi:hypothetical protein
MPSMGGDQGEGGRSELWIEDDHEHGPSGAARGWPPRIDPAYEIVFLTPETCLLTMDAVHGPA